MDGRCGKRSSSIKWRLIHFQYSTFTLIYLIKFGLFCCSRLYGKLLNVVNELFHSELLVINSFIMFAVLFV